MNMFRITAAILALCMSVMSMPASAANVSGNPEYQVDAPPAYSMVADVVIARPLLIAATVIGAGLFVVTLPFTLLGGGVDRAGQALVVEPGKAAFVRCLGCTKSGYDNHSD
ncbi:multidrug transporter [Pseudomonas sp. C27(2019)]|uniref:multidrug transporter n=1 Tax=Pseudomonas sp. C27(2019) TaxID=2604941 RepID=UPI0012479A65|nr:multidrug transporter [Pseudomonas sp. C27(2019)]QEY60155.1 multidrug transporter [Pseudomonas sp. C27(2019)]